MNTNDQSLPCDGTTLEVENVTNDFIENLFDEEGAFGEADCAGL